MKMNLPDLIVEVCKESHVPMAQAVFGDAGLKAIFAVMDAVKALYVQVEPERVTGRVVIFQRVSAGTPAAGAISDFALLVNQTLNDLVFEVGSDSRIHISSVEETLEKLAKNAVVYHYTKGSEEFLAGPERKPVMRLDLSAESQFAVPTLSTLRDALRLYEVESVRESTCYTFEHVWKASNRIFFVAGPEEWMRRSLTQFLRNRIGGENDVFPEQNVNEKNPVDIRVTPRFSNNRLMLIEIKWLGDSLADDGHITVSHRDARAQEGADQLAKYLDEQTRFAPRRITHGYYVIIDGRRAKLHPAMSSISYKDGLHFETIDIKFNPAPHLTRPDFDPPCRMFARPVCH